MSPWMSRDELMAAEDRREERLDRIRATGLGPDGNYHDDPYCAAIAPMGTPEARHGELCGMCERRRRAEAYAGNDDPNDEVAR